MSLTALQGSAHLHHLHLKSPQPEKLSDFYARAMDMKSEEISNAARLLIGRGRHVLISEGEAQKLGHVGFAMRDAEGLKGLRERAKETGLSPQECEAGGNWAVLFATTAALSDKISSIRSFGRR